MLRIDYVSAMHEPIPCTDVLQYAHRFYYIIKCFIYMSLNFRQEINKSLAEVDAYMYVHVSGLISLIYA